MLAAAAERTRDLPIRLVEGRAEELPFADGEFAALTFTYLLRYVDDPAATVRELARVVRPGGTIAMLEFAVPRGVWRPPWELWVRAGLPVAGRLISPGWHEVGDFLGPSIRELLAAIRPGRALPRGGHRGRARAAAQPRRRRRRLGPARRERGDASGLLRARAAAAGATTSRCSTRRTRSGTCRTSRSAPGLASPFSWTRCGAALAGVRARDGRRRARARRAARPTAADADPGADAVGARRRRRSRPRRRSASTRASRGRGGWRRSSSPAPSSSSRTTSSCSAAPSTRRSGSRSPGARCRRCPRTSSKRRRCASRPLRRPSTRRSSRTRSACSPRRCGSRGGRKARCGASWRPSCWLLAAASRLARCGPAPCTCIPTMNAVNKVDIVQVAFALSLVARRDCARGAALDRVSERVLQGVAIAIGAAHSRAGCSSHSTPGRRSRSPRPG